jgi:hypothetical protein
MKEPTEDHQQKGHVIITTETADLLRKDLVRLRNEIREREDACALIRRKLAAIELLSNAAE